MGAVSSEGMLVNSAAAGSQDPDDRTGAMTARVAKLTQGQLDCLLLVDQHLSSKEIAAELKISPHTVDQRIRVALQSLGVDRRTHAARIVARHHEPYQRLIHQSPYIEAFPKRLQVESQDQPATRPVGLQGSQRLL